MISAELIPNPIASWRIVPRNRSVGTYESARSTLKATLIYEHKLSVLIELIKASRTCIDARLLLTLFALARIHYYMRFFMYVKLGERESLLYGYYFL